ncbi:hypothetical protein MPOCJGCO_0654 [Methylobacterium trifolii]|uniref:Uncharacterized protein n=1 Tax=Methylobacterium trifolii TaxID=1003092 RepID=A0ABQ4TV62_9HYPH|nr:hypothetical protein MPOCJGCO_0654 [Methylobacterium trifolii]
MPTNGSGREPVTEGSDGVASIATPDRPAMADCRRSNSVWRSTADESRIARSSCVWLRSVRPWSRAARISESRAS